jgi:PhoH-like ATPase
MGDNFTKEFAKDGRPKLIIDTSSILANPEEVFNIIDSDIIIPMTVLEELDGKKKMHNELGRAARYFIRRLEDIRKICNIKLSDTIPIENNSTITIAINGLSEDILGRFGLSLDKHDNRIIGVALGFSEKYSNVKLLSLDTNMLVKSSALAIDCMEFPINNEEVYYNIHNIEVDKSELDLFHSNKSLIIEDQS